MLGGSPVHDAEMKPSTATDAHEGFDLLQIRGLRRVVGWAGFPRALQWAMLAVFLALIVLSWGWLTPAGVNAKLYAKSHLVTLLVWGLWWPAMVWTAVLLGRVWCMVCPLELVSTGGEKLARALGVRVRSLQAGIASGVVIAGFYALIQLLVAGVQINRVPAYTAIFLLTLLTVALLTGVVFRDRAFCRGFCPVGLLLGTYGRGGMIAVRPATAPTGQAPAPGSPRVCPSLLTPQKLASNRDCLVCCHCIQTLAPGAMGLRWRRPFAASDAREPMASWPVTAFVMLVSGFVSWELCTEWPAAERIFVMVPTWAATSLAGPAALGWFKGIWALFVVPLAVWSVLGGLCRLLGETDSLGRIWRRIALPMALVVAAGHMSKGLAKFVSWSPYLPDALRDPSGVDTARAIAGKIQPSPAAWLPLPVVGGVGVVLLILALGYALREQRLAASDGRHRWHSALPVGVLATVFGLVLAGWIL